jgi:beta-glucanase (GH16 family)
MRFVWILLVLLTADTRLTAQPGKPVRMPAGKTGKVIFYDDFNGPVLNRAKWGPVVTGLHVNDELQAYVDSAAVFYQQGGALVLRPAYAPGYVTADGQHFDFVSGRLTTQGKFDFTYGRAEARIRMDAASGLWPAWWLLGNGEWPNTGEIDIMEFIGEKDWASAAVHGQGYSGETPFVNRLYFPADDDVTHWHVYAVDWTPDSLLFSYDGKLVFRVTKSMTLHYGKWSFDTPKFLILNYALGGAYPEKINNTRKPYYGLTGDALETVKEKSAHMYVDWVRVTQF